MRLRRRAAKGRCLRSRWTASWTASAITASATCAKGWRPRPPWTALLLWTAACDARPPFAEAEPGLPLPGLSESQLEAFAAGQSLFNRPFAPEDGLGPIFNQDRCGSCHDLPTSGGHGAEPVMRVSRFDPDRGCSVLPELGGGLLQQIVTEQARRLGVEPERIPETATAASDVRAPAIYGLGLVEAVSEADLLRAADPDDADGDGISGRPNFDGSGRLGRFGRKARHATLRGFVEEAIRVEMGLTTPGHPMEELPGGRPLPPGADLAADPETGEAEIQQLVDYVRFLAPPGPRPPENPRAAAEVSNGEGIFSALGCAQCHVQWFETPADPPPPLARKRFRLYSDLLLHDMGPELADICAPGTTPSEWKTARLVGLGLRFEFLHDGRAQSLSEAILLHGGEATAARDAFRRLGDDERRQLLRFLQSL